MEAYLMNAMMKVKQQIDDVAKRINGMLDGCRHKAHLPPLAEDLRKKVQALCVQAGMFCIWWRGKSTLNQTLACFFYAISK